MSFASVLCFPGVVGQLQALWQRARQGFRFSKGPSERKRGTELTP